MVPSGGFDHLVQARRLHDVVSSSDGFDDVVPPGNRLDHLVPPHGRLDHLVPHHQGRAGRLSTSRLSPR
jgi:hypothetical protein